MAAIIPAYNEVSTVKAVVRGALQHVKAVVVVDDGSSDGTAAAAALAGATVIAHSVNRGKGAALRSGFAWALRHDFDLIFTLDADGQHDPSEMPRFVEAYTQTRADLIIGRRAYASMPFLRRWANRTGRWLLRLALGQDVPDNQSGYRLYSQRLLKLLQALEDEQSPARFSYEVDVIARAIGAGYSIAWVPIRTIYGGEQSHFHPLRDSLDFLRTVWRVWQTRRFIARQRQRKHS
ncbi:MAG: glycosyltransferase family 2 protein [Anaerolineae bacterium]|nr:glycosyltransferase family 2 protein [Anaerolineae bacterium]MDW8100605.1 glycosyltransferase family 2 protein [Anaerolineae bacterium]